MKIDISSQIVTAFKTGCSGYIPIFEGETLAPEGGLPETSFENLNTILAHGWTVVAIWIGESQNVLVVFASGETYLATGFSVGNKSEATFRFSRFIESIGWGKGRAIYKLLSALPSDFQGTLVPAMWGSNHVLLPMIPE